MEETSKPFSDPPEPGLHGAAPERVRSRPRDPNGCPHNEATGSQVTSGRPGSIATLTAAYRLRQGTACRARGFRISL